MDIKLKNIKYSSVTKGIAVFLVWLCVLVAASGAWFYLYNQEAVTTDSYYETYGFVSEYSRLVHNAAEYNVKFRDQDGVIIFSDTPGSITENVERYHFIKDRLSSMVNFAYYVKNNQTGEVISNINAADRVSLLKKQPTYIYIGKGEPDYSLYYNEGKGRYIGMYYVEDIQKMLEGTPFEIHAAIIEPLKQGDLFYYGSMSFARVKAMTPYFAGAAIAAIVVMLAALIYLIFTAGRKEEGGEIVLSSVDKTYTDVHTILVFIAAIVSVTIVIAAGGEFSMMGAGVTAAVVLSIDVFVGLSYILSMVRQIKNRQVLRNSLIYKLYSGVRNLFMMALDGKMFKPWIVAMLLGYGLVNGILFTIFVAANNDLLAFLFAGLLLAAFNIAAANFAAKSLKNLAQIMEAVKEVSTGNLDYQLNSSEMTTAFIGLADDLHNLQKGLRSAVEEAVKGERMKTELITNVSHDLKTPLTSIINYVDLLKKEEIESQTVREYIAVLEEKSARLKQLVEDLIEASKASSGNLAVNSERVDLNQLVMQAYGEYEEKLEKAGLDIRISTMDKSVLVYADGKHLWRVVENLISNVLKYSMPQSRVYVNIDRNEKYGVLTIKNISAFPLEISPEQLTERFVRGDASRSTEGSGLGLSIVQGLSLLQGGKFKVEIDGDLFKAIVEIPLWDIEER